MKTLTLVGRVPEFKGAEFLLPIDNEAEFRHWLESNKVDTHISLAQGKLAVKVRGDFVKKCLPGRRVRYTIEVFERRDGRRIRGVEVETI